MDTTCGARMRLAVSSDLEPILELWEILFRADGTATPGWQDRARAWFGGLVDRPDRACFPVVITPEGLVAVGSGSIECCIVRPERPSGRVVRLGNLVVHPDHRRHGHGAALVDEIVRWSRTVGADEVFLDTTEQGRSLYQRAGFDGPSARMSLPFTRPGMAPPRTDRCRGFDERVVQGMFRDD